MALIVNGIEIENVVAVKFSTGERIELEKLQDAYGTVIWAGFKKLRQFIDRSIESVTAEDLEGVSMIKPYAFYECKNLKSVQLPDTCSRVGTYAFYGCKNLKSVHLPDTCSRVDGYAFEYCTGLEELDVGNTTDYLGEYSFAYCSNLKTINLRNVTALGTMAFGHCTSLTNIELPEGLKNLDAYEFQDCTGLTYIKIPATVTYFDPKTFEGCTNLKTVRFSSIEPPLFASASNFPESVTRIEVPSESLSAYQEKAENTNYDYAQLMVGV